MFIWHFVYPFICWWTFGCFYCLVLVNNAVINMGVQVLFQILLSIPWGIYPEAELLYHMIILFLISWVATTLFSIAAVTILHSWSLFSMRDHSTNSGLKKCVLVFFSHKSSLQWCSSSTMASNFQLLNTMVFILKLAISWCKTAAASPGLLNAFQSGRRKCKR